jgi:hypothetical protein
MERPVAIAAVSTVGSQLQSAIPRRIAQHIGGKGKIQVVNGLTKTIEEIRCQQFTQ